MLKPKQITAGRLARRIERQLGFMRSYGRFATYGVAEEITDGLRRTDLTRDEHQRLADQWTALNKRARNRHWFDLSGLPDPFVRHYQIIRDPDVTATEHGTKS